MDPVSTTAVAEDTVVEATIAVIICAAGASTRMGGIKKEYCILPDSNGMTVLGAAVSVFASVPEIKNIIITGKDAAQKDLLPLAKDENSPSVHFVDGGATRQASVFNALSMITTWQNKQPDFVLIHDGARSWVSVSLIKRIIAELKKIRAVIPLLPITETPKEIDGEWNNAMLITRHLKRVLVGVAQTPQGFAFPEIFTAHQQAAEYSERTHHEFTDDAEIWASFCGPVSAIPGDPKNRKITFPEDLC
jgi:2-C-methyl-D-erythritol 4-phosphate cytidylyltransferase